MDKNKKISLSIDVLFERGGTVFQTAALFLDINPETSSRVTLASLGIAFQADLLSGCFVVWLFC